MAMIIPDHVKVADRGVYIAYYVIGIQNRKELETIFPYKGRNTLWTKIKRIRKAVSTV